MWRPVVRLALFSALLPSGLAARDAAPPLRVSIACAAPAPSPAQQPFHVRLRAEPLAEPGNAGVVAREWDVEVPGEAALALAPQSGWRVAVAAPGYWAPEALVRPGERAPVAFRLLPTGTIGGRVTLAARAEKPPAALEVRFKGAPGRDGSGVPLATITCPLREQRWECEVPAVALDLRVRAEGFIPRYLWGVTVRPGKRSELGAFELARGASLVGWVEIAGAAPPGQAPEVQMTPYAMARGSQRGAAERLAQRSLTARPTERGFFQFTGVQAGEYAVTACLAGFAPATPIVAKVPAGSEAELRGPLVLAPPLTLEVRLQPPLDPLRQPWRFRLSAQDPARPPNELEAAGQGTADLAGLLRQPGLAPGRFLLLVRDAAGSEWLHEWIDLVPGQSPLDFRIPLVAVEGRISAGKEPLQATLWLTTPQGVPRIRFDADTKGEFAGSVSKEGEWWVDLELPAGGLQALDPVDVRRAPGSSVARLEIHVPNTRLLIRVTDERDKPVPGAEVIALSAPEKRRRQAQLQSDDRGEVELRGLSPGVVQLYAHKQTAAADWVAHTVVEDRDDPPVPLVLREKLRLSGRVLAPEGPVPGALVVVFPDLAAVNAFAAEGVSDADGHFEVQLDRSFSSGSLALFAPGFAVRMLPVAAPAPESPELALAVAQEAGNLLVDGRGIDRMALARGRLVHNGAGLSLLSFVATGRASRSEDGLITLPMMEPGQYAYCPHPASLPQTCVTGLLVPGGDLKLAAPGAGGGKTAPTKTGRPHLAVRLPRTSQGRLAVR